jgi:asparagine synthase (glutamine-hydrolysing)
LNRLDIALSEGVDLYARLMKSPSRFEMKKWRRALGIESDYDDYWLFRKFWRDDLPLRTRLQYLDFHTYLPDDILTKVDRVSMAVSLETRVPLLDRRVVEFAFRLPESIRYCDGELKGLLKRAYRGVLPDRILSREKKGFSPPRHYLDLGRRSQQEYILNEHFADSLERMQRHDTTRTGNAGF